MSNTDDDKPKNEPVGLEEDYYSLDTIQMRAIEAEKKQAKREARIAKRHNSKNKRRSIITVLAAVVVFGAVTATAITLSNQHNDKVLAEKAAEEVAKEAYVTAEQRALNLIAETGAAFYEQLAEKYENNQSAIDSIESTGQSEGTIVEDDRGESYIISGMISGIPADFSVEESITFFEEPLEGEPLWTFKYLEESEEITSQLMPGDTLVQAVKFSGMSFVDGTPIAVTLIYATDADGLTRVVVNAAVLVMEGEAGVENTDGKSTLYIEEESE